MKCEEFRRRLLQEPGCKDPEFVAHREQCSACAEEAREVERMEAMLTGLLNVDAPPDLKTDLLRRTPRSGWPPLAMAASLAAILALTTLMWSAGPDDADLVTEVLDHVSHEPQAFAALVPLSGEAVKAVNRAVSLDPAGLGHPVTYAMPCELRGGPGLHLVMQAQNGPVTLLVITAERISEPQLAGSGPYRAAVRPIDNGSLAVVGGVSQPVEALAKEMASRVRVEI